jgi:hypothetical protein
MRNFQKAADSINHCFRFGLICCKRDPYQAFVWNIPAQPINKTIPGE